MRDEHETINPPATANHNQSRILRNASYLTVAFILQKILSFLYFVYIARIIGPVDLGLYDPIKSLIPILLIVIDFSLSIVLVREIARSPHRAEEFLSNVLGIKVLFAMVILFAMGLFTNFSNYSVLTKAILYLDGVVVVLDTFTLTFFAVFRGLQNMKFESIGMIITQLITVIVGVAGLRSGYDLRALFFAIVLGSIGNFVFSILLLRKKLKIRIRLAWNREIITMFLKTALPFAIAAILVKVYTYTDRYMLLAWAGKGFEGWYVTAHKFTYALEFIPSAFAASIFPAMSTFYLTSKADLTRTFEQAMRYLIILSVPISLGIFTLADKIILSLSGAAYETSIAPLRILICGLLVIFLNFPVGAFLNACNRQKINTINMGIAVTINVILNIILIREYTVIGAAIAALISGFVLFFLGLRHVSKVITYSKAALLRLFVKTTSAGLAMASVLYILKVKAPITIALDSSPLWENVGLLLVLAIYIITGFIVYASFLVLLGGIDLGDMKFLFQKIIRRKK